MCCGAVMPRRTPSRPCRSTRTSMPSPMMMASLSFLVTTSTGSALAERQMHRIVVIVADELTTDHAAGIDDDRRAQVDRGAVADDSDQRQPHQRLFAGAEADSFEGAQREIVGRVDEHRIDGQKRGLARI